MPLSDSFLVVGAGPSGIASVGALLDQGLNENKISWVDPQFAVGDLGTIWKNVESNTPVKSFKSAYQAVSAFDYVPDRKCFFIDRLAEDLRCPLAVAAQPLELVTQSLMGRVRSFQDYVTQLAPIQGGWEASMASGKRIRVHKVILALGAEPNVLNFAHMEPIELSLAADPNALFESVVSEDVIAVFGAYQSARTVEQNLAKTRAKAIYHFYRSQREFDNHIASLQLDSRVHPVQISSQNLLKYTPLCNKVIYAIGFKRRHVSIKGLPEDYGYNPDTGEILPGIYGIGIAFPEILPNWMGRQEYRVSAVKPFVKRIKKLVPSWINQPQPNTDKRSVTTYDEVVS